MDIALYQKIKKEYDDFYKSIMRGGKLPMRETSQGFWGAAVADEVFEAFKKAGLKNCKNFLDIGSGDGKIVLIASLFAKNSFGIEIDESLVNKSIEIKEKLAIKNAGFSKGDFYEEDFSKYDFLFCNPDSPIERMLEKKLLKEMKGRLIVYGSQFIPKKLFRESEFKISGTDIFVFINCNDKKEL